MIYFKNELLEAAAQQLALDMACTPQDFLKDTNTVVLSKELFGRRLVTGGKDFFRLAGFGNGAVASVDPQMYTFARALLEKLEGIRVFDAEGVYVINKELEKYGKALDGFHEYYLPRMPYPFLENSAYRLEVYEGSALTELYPLRHFQNALLFQNTAPRRDVLAVAAKNAGHIIGLAGASNDSDRFWQIGIDVTKEFRQKGLATLLVSTLTQEILMRGAIPYYGTWWANTASRNVALNCHYYPAWVEMSAIDVQ